MHSFDRIIVNAPVAAAASHVRGAGEGVMSVRAESNGGRKTQFPGTERWA